MQLSEYQEKSKRYIIDAPKTNPFTHWTLGLVGEAGEIANHGHKLFRDHNGSFKPEVQKEIAKEIGDTLWYLSQVASSLNLSLDEIAQQNLDKLESRLKRNVIVGEGDNR